MKKFFSRIKLEPRASVALFKNDSSGSLMAEKNKKTEMYDQLQNMLKEHDEKEKLESKPKTVWGMEFPTASEDIPMFLFSAMEYLVEHGLETQGIFRHSTSKSREERAMLEIDQKFIDGGAKEATIDFGEFKDVHLAASLIKLYLRKLNEPLLTNKLYDSFLATAKMTSPRSRSSSIGPNNGSVISPEEIEQAENVKRVQLLRKVVHLLPEANFVLLKRLCLFLNRVTRYQQKNLMSPENVAIVFQPNILYLKDQDPMETIRDISNATNVIKSLIVHAPEIFDERDIATEPEVPTTCTSPASTPVDEETKTDTKPKKVIQLHSFFANLLSQSFKDGLAYYKGDTNESGEKHGHGILMYPNGGVFEGEFVKNLREGKGKMGFTDGSKYEGEFEKDLICGRGVYKYANGDVYDGHFVNGVKHGKGKMKYAANQSHYDGEWINDKRDGFGKQSYSNGDIYEGEWKEDKSSGFGTFVSTGYSYEGYWKDGKFNGNGKFVLLDTKETCQGSWIDGQFHGETLYTDAQGRQFNQVYEKGELISSERHIDENEKRVIDLLHKLMSESIRSNPQVKTILDKNILNSTGTDPSDHDNDQEKLRNALFNVMSNPETTIVFDLLTSLVDLLSPKSSE